MCEQMELDLRLRYERNLKDNLDAVSKFAGEQMRMDLESEGRPLKTVVSAQEAYGIAMQQYVKVQAAQKILKNGMDDFLKLMETDNEVVQVSGSIYNAAIELAQEGILMAVQASRILKDLYYRDTTPIEEYLDSEDLEEAEPETEEEETEDNE